MVKNCKTLGDLLDYIGEVAFDFTLYIYNYKGARFGGYTRGKLTKGDTILDESDTEELELSINNCAIGDRFADVKLITPIYVAGEDFEHFYNAVFYNSDENISEAVKTYVKDNIKDYDDDYEGTEVRVNRKGWVDVLYQTLTEEEKINFIVEEKSNELWESEASIYWDWINEEYSA
jgi:hypothetical protein